MRLPSLPVASLAALLVATPAFAASDYFALGDSITFGETNLAYVPSYGDRGYVAGVADYIAALNGGPRPNVTDLAIDGETTTSFFTNAGRTPPVVGRGDAPLQLENLNYSTTASSQYDVLAAKVAAAQAAGDTVDNVSITLGFNDLAALASLPPADALAAIDQTLVTYRTDYGNVLTQIRALLPNATLYVLGYYNPFPADMTSPAASIFNTGGVALNGIIGDLAAQYGGLYIETAPAFIGNEAAYTYLAEQPANATVAGEYGGALPIGNVHPNALGYAAIAGAVSGSSGQIESMVPEPAAWTLMIGGFGLVGAAVRRSRRLATAG
ncbi:MAG: GDSL-type esterase/lipase family protein [Janthinobacterium lividum]